MVVPVRIRVGIDAQRFLLAHTLDASKQGICLGGVHEQLHKGEIVTVHYQHRRGQFRVVWVGARGTSKATQVGLQPLDAARNIWGTELPEPSSDQPVASALSQVAETATPVF